MGKKLVVDVRGMHCAACSARIERVVAGLNGVEQAQVNLAAETLSLNYHEEAIDYDSISLRVKDLGFELVRPDTSKNRILELNIEGMHCAACSSRIEKVVSGLEGISAASVSLATERGNFVYDASQVGPRRIKDAITSLGFSSTRVTGGGLEYEEKDRENRKLLEESRKRLVAKLILVIPLLYISMGEMIGAPLPSSLSPQTSPLMFALVQGLLAGLIMWLGRHFYLNGVPALLKKSPNMDSLIAVGTGAAFIYSIWNTVEIFFGISLNERVMDLYFESAGVLVALVSLGKYLESRSKYQTSDAIRMLMQLSPKTAVLVDGDDHITVDADEIEAGDVLFIKPGASLPTDGVVLSGESAVDESLMTGEPMPVTKREGDRIFGGTMNTTGTFKMTASQTGENTLLAGIIRMVQKAQGTKPSIAKIADRVSYYFVPAVMMFAVVTGLCWFYFGEVGFSQSLRFFIAVMVIACPCAMGLATPISVMVGTGRGAQLGILVKNSETLEKLEKVTTIIFDKTGTITKGKPELTEVITAPGFDEKRFLALVASAEKSSEHPLAEAVLNFAERNDISLLDTEDFQSHSGRGIEAVIDNEKVCVGNYEFCNSFLASPQNSEETAKIYSEEGKTFLYASVDGKYAGQVVIADGIKNDAFDTISELQSANIDVVMLTGDSRATAEAVARNTGITHVVAEVLPDKKAEVVTQFQEKAGIVAMVGDGINDAPALAKADIGIAMGTGIDIAIESGDVVIMRGDLKGVATAVNLSRAVMKNIRQNLFWAFAYNVLGIPIAAGFLYIFGGPALNPMIAGAAMALSSVSVVANALRLRFFTK